MRGAQGPPRNRPSVCVGTSPLAWSSVTSRCTDGIFSGDISTCVELSSASPSPSIAQRGHLHLRGAQNSVYRRSTVTSGTSPLAWSSVHFDEKTPHMHGDISTCVELSTRCLLLRLCLWGHLHSRGAQATAQPSHQVTTGTSPLAWSSGGKVRVLDFGLGDIATRVELSPTPGTNSF